MSEKTLDEHFVDWEADTFGFGYGTGEEFTVPLLWEFLAALQHPENGAYDHAKLEAAFGGQVAWLMINILCRADIIEYGTSPRHGWLTAKGRRLQEYVLARSKDDLLSMATQAMEDYVHCYPNACNCGPNGYDGRRICPNPFWRKPNPA